MVKEKVKVPVSMALAVLSIALSIFAIAYVSQPQSQVKSGSEKETAVTVVPTIYVNSANGNDANSGATVALAKKTIQAAVNKAVPGDIIGVMSGTYPERVNVSVSGTATAPINIISADGANPNQGISPDVTTYGFTLSGVSNVIINGFKITITAPATDNTKDGAGVALINSQNCQVVNNYIYKTVLSGIRVSSWGGGVSSGNYIGHNKIEYAGGWSGLLVEGGSNNTFEDNNISHSLQNPLIASGIKSIVNGPDADGIKVSGSRHIFRGNYIHDITFADAGNQNGTTSPHIDGVQITGPASDIIFDGNRIELPCDASPVSGVPYLQQVSMIQNNQGSVSGLVFENNVLSACRGINVNKIDSINILDSVKIYNNTIHDTQDYGILIKGATNVKAQNNIFYNSGLASTNNSYWYDNSSSTIGYNDQYFSSGMRPTKLFASDLSVNPSFVNPGSDYHLQTSSPVINSGMILAEVNLDFDNVPRPQNGAYDMGAFEKMFTVCNESWSCGTWGDCVGGGQARICVDANGCGTRASMPAISQPCTVTSTSTATSTTSTGAVTKSITSICGNSVLEGAEQCDNKNLNSQTCVTKGFTGGTLACSASCTFNTAGCTSACVNSCKGYLTYFGKKYYYTSCITAGKCCAKYKNLFGTTITKCK